MGYREMDLVWKHSQATRLDKFVLLAIAKTYNKGKGSYPSQAKLAEMTGIADARGIRRSLQRLMKLGELEWLRGSNQKGKSNVYFITFVENEPTKMTAINDQNDRSTRYQIDPLLNKGLDKLLSRERTLVFSSDPFSEFHRVVSDLRPDMSVVQVTEWLTYFASSKHAWWIDNAHTDGILLDKVLACFPRAEGEM